MSVINVGAEAINTIFLVVKSTPGVTDSNDTHQDSGEKVSLALTWEKKIPMFTCYCVFGLHPEIEKCFEHFNSWRKEKKNPTKRIKHKKFN